MTTYYKTNREYISEELKRIDLLIYQQILRIRQKKEVVDGFQGIYVSDDEINSILDIILYPANEDEDHRISTLKGLIAELKSQIEEKKVAQC